MRLEQLLRADQKAVFNINLRVRLDTAGCEQTGARVVGGRDADPATVFWAVANFGHRWHTSAHSEHSLTY